MIKTRKCLKTRQIKVKRENQKEDNVVFVLFEFLRNEEHISKWDNNFYKIV